eukprot:CAMPEP_0167766574 /NCGR_PEP_ID=MMETSP0110_2-20121227/15434_1 /TAXON_ID=629695 /ORGANISM="Gymnochlora sp., Strain CCMP2014" /LENGTH=462 /DNA_ID=CAMNT_0007654645 /DNA_START=32 /DNA_END=1420 /DNA_ORIENTATION=+
MDSGMKGVVGSTHVRPSPKKLGSVKQRKGQASLFKSRDVSVHATESTPKGLKGIKKVGIIGAGIGGLATAVALHRYCGITPYIFEKRGKYADFGKGTGISVAPHGLDALKHIDDGAFEKALKTGKWMEALETEAYGKVKVDASLVEWPKKYGYPGILIRWADIHKILMETAEDIGVPIKFCSKLEEIQSDGKDGPVKVKFEGEDEPEEFDLLIGSDGINSVVRELVFDPDKVFEPKPVGRWLTRAVLPATDEVLSIIKKEGEKLCIRENRHAFLLLNLGNGYAKWCAYTKVLPGDSTYVPKSGKESKDYMLGFKLYPEVQKLADMTPTNEIFSSNLKQMETPLNTWISNRVILLGDSAHALTPTLGQGANMAMEDALQLAVSLKGTESVEDGLEHYESIRLPRTTTVLDYNVKFARDQNLEKEEDKEQSFFSPDEFENYIFSTMGATKPRKPETAMQQKQFG